MTENQVSRRNFLKKVVPVIAGVGLAGALGIDRTFGLSSNPSFPTGAPTPGNQLSTASYIIDNQKNFIAQNGTTGKIDFSGSDPTGVVQAAIDALPNGGLIFIRKGVYPTTGAIVLKDGIHLLGEQGAVLRVQDNAQDSSNPFNILEVKGDNVTIENLELDGNTGANPNLAGTTLDSGPANPNVQSGLVVRSGQGPEILNCYIHDTWNSGIWLAATDGNVEGAEIASCQIEETGRSYADSSSSNPPQSANAIYAFRLSASTSGSNIHDNVILNTYGRGIYLHFDTNSMVSSNVITNSQDLSQETGGIIVDDETKRVVIRGNQISGHGPGILVVWAGCEDIIIEANSCFNAPNCGGAGSGILVDSSNKSGPPLRSIIIRGNICKGNALSGISIAAAQAIVEGNICYDNHKDTMDLPERRAGILCQTGQLAAISNVSIIGNRCFDDQAVPTQYYGVSVSQMGNQITDILVSNNDLRGNGFGGIGLLECSSHRVTGNLGFNPQGLDSIVVGNSPFAYVNRDGVPEALYVMGGLVSEISKNGTIIFTSTPATVLLDPDESITIVHSDPPLVQRDKR